MEEAKPRYIWGLQKGWKVNTSVICWISFYFLEDKKRLGKREKNVLTKVFLIIYCNDKIVLIRIWNWKNN